MPSWRAGIGAALLALMLVGLGRLPLLDPDEGRYARTAQEMGERGDLVVPHFEGVPRLQKPVLFYWLEMASFAIFGQNAWAARLPSALAALGTLLWVHAFARPRLGDRAALAACAILATTPLFFAFARTASTDMTLTFFVFGATVSLYAGIVEPSRPVRHLVVAGLCLGLGVLTKGPVAMIFPAFAIPAAALARKRAPITIAGRATAVAWIMIAVVAPWLALLLRRVEFADILEIWRRETVERVAQGLDHPESPAYYFLTFPATFFPWTALLPFALVATARRLRTGAGLAPFLLAWFCGAFAFFSLGSGKLDAYLLPIAPAAALLIARAASDEGLLPSMGRWGARILAVVGALALLPLAMSHDLRENSELLAGYSLAAAAAALTTALLARAGRERAIVPTLAVTAGVLLIITPFALPGDLVATRSTRDLVAGSTLLAGQGPKSGSSPFARSNSVSGPSSESGSGSAGGPDPIYAMRLHAPSLDFYAGRTATYVPSRSMLLKSVEDGAPAWIVLEEWREDAVRPLLARGFRVVSRSGGRLLMRRPPGGTVRGAAS